MAANSEISGRGGQLESHLVWSLGGDLAAVVNREKLQDQFAYPPRLMRAYRAAAYLDMGERTFLRLVAEGKLPKPKRFNGVVAWDRYRLDTCIEDADDDVAENTVDQLLRERQDD